MKTILILLFLVTLALAIQPKTEMQALSEKLGHDDLSPTAYQKILANDVHWIRLYLERKEAQEINRNGD